MFSGEYQATIHKVTRNPDGSRSIKFSVRRHRRASALATGAKAPALEERIIHRLAKSGGSMTRRDLLRSFKHVPADRLEAGLGTLQDTGKIQVSKMMRSGMGRPSTRVLLVPPQPSP